MRHFLVDLINRSVCSRFSVNGLTFTDNTRVIRDLQKYLDEVITHLSTTDNCDVELSLEVSANAPDGFAQETVRTVSENCRTLRVDNFGFDK